EKVSIIVSKGSLEGIYPALIMANGARAEGIEASLFFTFFGLDAISRKRHQHIKMAAVGNPGLHLATLAGALPGMPGLMTSYLERKMGKLDIPPIPEFIEMIADTGAGTTAARHPATCSASPKMTSSSRSRTSSRWASSMPSRPEARSSSPDRAACPHRGVGSVTAAKPEPVYPGGYTWYHRRNVRSTHVQPSRLRPRQEDHLDWLRPACGAGPRRDPAREPLHLPLKPRLNAGQAAST